MNVIFTCGGTGGHINPALAVAKLLRERRPDDNILFVGAEDGMECDLVPREGFRLETLEVSNFQRKPTPKALAHNIHAVRTLGKAFRKADELIKSFQPDVILGTGGYASYPMLRQGARHGVPTAVHESNAIPGLTTKMAAKTANRILVNFDESRGQYKTPDRVKAVGMPVRQEFLYTTRAEARKKLNLDERPLVVSYWGSLGAREMNKKIAEFFLLETKAGDPWQHTHATGSFGWRWMPEYVAGMGVTLAEHPSISMREYLYDMPLWMNAADVLICRAGASTLSEIAMSGTPCILVPSPNVAANHQEKNARVLEKRGAALVLRENECGGGRLYEAVERLLGDQPGREAMRKALRELAVVDSAERILNEILELARKEAKRK